MKKMKTKENFRIIPKYVQEKGKWLMYTFYVLFFWGLGAILTIFFTYLAIKKYISTENFTVFYLLLFWYITGIPAFFILGKSCYEQRKNLEGE